MMLPIATVFCSPFDEHFHEFQVMLLEKRNDSVVEHFSGDKRILPVIQLCKPDFGIGVDDCLLDKCVPHL